MKRKIPYGVINWEDLVRNCYVVDNTAYIRELEECKTPIVTYVVEVCSSRGYNWFEI